MSIATEITRLQGAKSDLKTSIESKGVTVPSATKIDGYAALVDQIQQGGGGGHTGTVDTVGLQALGWDSTDIQWLQDHVWWDAEDDAEWAVTEANKAFGPAGATPLTWSNYTAQQYNPDLRYFPKLTTPTGTSMNSKFNGYIHLVAIPTHGWDMSAITNYTSCFRDCYNLRSVNVDNWVTTATTTIFYMFNHCVNMADFPVTNWNTSNVTNMNQAFGYCSSMTDIDISGFSFAKVTDASYMFSTCASLRTIKLPTTISAPVLTTLAGFLTACVLLETLDMNLTAASLTSIQALVDGCFAISSVKLAISSTVLSNIRFSGTNSALLSLDLTSINTTACGDSGVGTNVNQSPLGSLRAAATIKLGTDFFKGSFTTLYATQSNSWTRDSIYESLYTNQTTRNSNSNAVTVKLATQAYDRLSAQDISDIATKNITLTRG